MALSKYSTNNARRHGPVGLVCDKIDVMITYTHTQKKMGGKKTCGLPRAVCVQQIGVLYCTRVLVCSTRLVVIGPWTFAATRTGYLLIRDQGLVEGDENISGFRESGLFSYNLSSENPPPNPIQR